MYQRIKTCNFPIHITLNIAGSKDIAHRALMLASLADGVSELHNLPHEPSILSLIQALQEAGIVIQYDESTLSCVIAGCQGALPKKQISFWFNQIEPTAYYLLGLASITKGVYSFNCPSLLQPLIGQPLLDKLKQQSVQILPDDATQMPFTLVGTDGLQGGAITFNQALHPQIFSTLLMISPFAKTPCNFSFEKIPDTYLIELSCTLMAEFGVLVHRIHHSQFMIPAPQRYHARNYEIEPDLALAAYWFAAAAVTGGQCAIHHLKRASCKQSGIKILSALEKMGCTIHENANTLTLVAPTVLKGIEISLKDFSAIFIIIAAIAPFAETATTITHIGVAGEREVALLRQFGEALSGLLISVEMGTDWIKILPSTPRGTRVNTHHNHYLGMAYAILGLRIPDLVIENADCVTAIYPEFYPLWDKLSTNTLITEPTN